MKILTESEPVKTSKKVKKIGFGVSSSPKMFDIISNKLYQNPIQAIIRELSCNAHDSHVEAGRKETPFDVQIPTLIDQEFYIRDYGTGISPQKIEEVYTMVFESDRTDSNEFTGGFGLGSKTPFSYEKSQSFLVESFYEGMKYTYVAMKENGYPALHQMETQETDEPSGLKVSFIVSPEDNSKFEQEAVEVYRWFEVQPNINIDLDSVDKHEKIREGDNWSIISSNAWASSWQTIYVRMGNVAYPVHKNKLSQQYVKNCATILDFNIGEIEPTPSREDIHYDDKTLELLEDRLKSVKESLTKEYKEGLQKCTSYRRACEYYFNSCEKYTNVDDIPFKNRELKRTIYLDIMEYGQCFEYNRNRYGITAIKSGSVYFDYSESNKYEFFINDLEKTHITRIRKYVYDKRNVVFLIDNDKIKDFCRKTGVRPTDFRRTSELPKPVNNNRSLKGVGNLYVHHYYKTTISSYWKHQEVDFSKGGYYIKTYNNQIVKPDHTNKITETHHPFRLANIISFLEDEGVKVPLLHGIRKSDWKKLDDNWKCGFKMLSEKLNKFEKKYKKDIKLFNSKEMITSDDGIRNALFNKSSVPKDSKLFDKMQFLDKIDKQNIPYTHSKLIDKYNRYREFLGQKKISEVEKGLEQTLKEVTSSYPLIRFFDEMTKQEITDYLNLIENNK